MAGGDEQISSKASASMAFINRIEEMNRIRNTLKRAGAGEGELLIIRGEAGSGKTRLMQECSAEAEKMGLSVGFGVALAESVVPYHPWREVLGNLGLDAILEERPPPKLLGLYLIAEDGGVLVRVEREGTDSKILSDLTSILVETVRNPDSSDGVPDGAFLTLQRDKFKIVSWLGSVLHLGAVVEGDEDEGFFADMMALGNEVESIPGGEASAEEEPLGPMKARWRQLIDSGVYEGIDYAKADPSLRQSRLFEHVTLGLVRKATGNPICIAIDDLQWADPSSLSLLHYVARNTRETRVAILATYRVEEAEARPHLRKFLKGMKQEEILNMMDMIGLSRDDLSSLVKSFIGLHSLTDDFLDHLWGETRGFPLFVREVLLRLEEDKEIVARGSVKCLVDSPEKVALPMRVRDVIRARLDRLPSEDRRLLDAAATCGGRFTASIVSKIAGEEEMKVLNGLDAIARVHGLLRQTKSGFAFDHPAVQEVLYTRVPSKTRQAYHKEAAEWLELAGGPIEDIGEHYYRAADPRAAVAFREAALGATGRYSNEEALRFYIQALELESDERGRMEILSGLGRVYLTLGDFDKCVEFCNTALELAKENRDRADAMATIGTACQRKGNYEESARMYEDALRLVGDCVCREQAVILQGLGNVKMFVGELDAALDYLQQSREVFEEVGDEAGSVSVLNNIGSVHYKKGDYDGSLEFYQKSLGLSEKLGNLELTTACLNNIANIHQARGSFEMALEYYHRSVDISKRIGRQDFLGNHLQNIGALHAIRGDHDRALEYFERSFNIRERIGDQQGLAWLLRNMGGVHRLRGDYRRAHESLEKGARIMKRIGDQQGLVLYLINTGLVELDRRHYGRALRSFAKGLAIAERIGYLDGKAGSLFDIGRVHLERGEYDEALGFLEEGLAIREKMGRRVALVEFHCAIAEVYLKKKELEKATQFCESAMGLSREIGLRGQIGLSRRILGKLRAEQGKWWDSEENFTESIRIFSEIGQKYDEAMSNLEFGLMLKQKGDMVKAQEHQANAVELFDALGLEERATEALEMLDAEV